MVNKKSSRKHRRALRGIGRIKVRRLEEKQGLPFVIAMPFYQQRIRTLQNKSHLSMALEISK